MAKPLPSHTPAINGDDPLESLDFNKPPIRQLITILLGVFLVEAALMLLLGKQKSISSLGQVVIDSFLLVILVFPILYFIVLGKKTFNFATLRLILIIEAAVFLGEALVMVLLTILPRLFGLSLALLDSFLLVVIITPFLYYYLLRPITSQMEYRKRVGEALRKSNELLERLFSITHVLYAYLDSEFNFIRVNRTYAEAGNHPPEYFVGKNHFDLYPHKENEAIFGRVVETGEPFFIFDKPFTYPDQPDKGVTYWDWSLLPILAADGTVDGVLLSLVDVTQRKKAQLAAIENERRFRAIFNQTFQFTGLMDPDGKVLEVNQTSLDFSGFQRSEVVGLHFWEISGVEFSAASWEGLKASFTQAAGGQFFRGEAEFINRDKEATVVDYSLKPVFDDEGNVTLVIWEARDITKRKRAEEELVHTVKKLNQAQDELQVQNEELEITRDKAERERQRYQDLFNFAPDGYLVTDCDGLILEANQAAADLFNMSQTELIRQPLSDFVVEHSRRVLHRRMLKLLSNQNYIRSELSLRDWEIAFMPRSGNSFVASLNVTSVRAKNGKTAPIGLRWLIRDITARKLIEEQLRLQTTAVDSAANGIIITDRDGRIQWSNPAFSQISGYTTEEILGKNPRVIKSDQQNPEFYRLLWETILAGKVWRGELVNRRKDGSLYHEEQTIAPVLDQEGKITHFIAIKQDITERKRADALLAEKNRELLELSQKEHEKRKLAEVLSNASRALTETLELETVLDRLLDYIFQLVPSDSAEIILVDGRGKLSIRATRGHHLGISELPVAIPPDLMAEVFLDKILVEKQSVLIADTKEHSEWRSPLGDESVRSWLGIPLVVGEQVIGICGMASRTQDYYTAEHIRLIETLTNQAAVVVQNAWLFDQVRGGRERLQYLSHQLVQIQESERRYIARELHDEAGQALASLMLGLGVLEKEIPSDQVDQVRKLKDIANNVLENLHRLAIDLRPASLDYLGLVEAIRQYIRSLSCSDLNIQFKTTSFDTARLPVEMETALYRIVQEALTNVSRHASARHVDVLLERRPGKVVVMIEDDGMGFEIEEAKSIGQLGLIGMQERAEMLGGHLEIESTPGVGTIIVVEVPDEYPNIHRR